MVKLRVGIVDDDESKVTSILTRLKYPEYPSAIKKEKYSNYQIEVVEFEICQELDEMFHNIMEEQLDCILIDYKLSSLSRARYNGVELAQRIDTVRKNFPILILTSYEDDLFSKELFDVFQVFNVDRFINDPKESEEINSKIIEQYEMNKLLMENWRRELLILLKKDDRNSTDDSRMLELDSLIENSLDSEHALNIKQKKDLSNSKLDLLIEKIDELLMEDE